MGPPWHFTTSGGRSPSGVSVVRIEGGIEETKCGTVSFCGKLHRFHSRKIASEVGIIRERSRFLQDLSFACNEV